MKPIKIAIFASGGGTNAENICKYFFDKPQIASIELILSNNSEAGVIERARKMGIPLVQFNKKMMNDSSTIIDLLVNQQIDLIILAGYLLLVPPTLIEKFKNKIINIHPSLLPKYGGKGMFGYNVHKAVFENKETESGITIHYVNEHFDEGKIIFQGKVNVQNAETFEEIARKVFELEMIHYPVVIEKLCLEIQDV